jgi:hypothetical protein
METGILSPYTAVSVDNSIYWVGRDAYGSGIVYRAQGFTPQRVSTNAIELILQAAPTPSTLRAYTYQEEGHAFYIITGGGMSTTLVYDISTKIWHERAYLNDAGVFEAHLAATGTFGFGQQLVIDRINGNIYTQSLSVYSDNGEVIARERIFSTLTQENVRAQLTNLTVGFETGVGLQTGNDANPLVAMTMSKDGGKTWSGEQITSIGRVGQYKDRAVFRRLGIARQITFKIRIAAKVKIAIIGAYLNTSL